MSIEVGNDYILFPRDSHPFELSQAVVVRWFIFDYVFGEERDVGEAIEDDLIDVLELVVWFDAVD